MPKIRYTKEELKRLAQSMRDFYEPPKTASDEEQKEAKTRKYLVEWCLFEDIPQGELARIVRRSKLLTRSYKRVLMLQELRLAKMGETAKHPGFSIFALKNKAGWRDDPDAAKAKNNAKLTLQLILPPKQEQGMNKSLAGIATAQVIDEPKTERKSKRFQVKELPQKTTSKVQAKRAKNEGKAPTEAQKTVSEAGTTDNSDKPEWMREETGE